MCAAAQEAREKRLAEEERQRQAKAARKEKEHADREAERQALIPLRAATAETARSPDFSAWLRSHLQDVLNVRGYQRVDITTRLTVEIVIHYRGKHNAKFLHEEFGKQLRDDLALRYAPSFKPKTFRIFFERDRESGKGKGKGKGKSKGFDFVNRWQ